MNRLRFRVGGGRRGLTILETAIALPIFLLILFGIVDIGRVLFAHLTLQHAVREAGRFAVTGRSLPGSSGSHPRLDSIIQVVLNDSTPFRLTSGNVHVSSASGGDGSPGGPGDRVTIEVVYRVAMITPLIGEFFPGGGVVVDVSTTFRNEPFPPGNSG